MSRQIIGTFDTLMLTWLVITYLVPIFGREVNHTGALQAATYIAVTEVVTKMVLYFLTNNGGRGSVGRVVSVRQAQGKRMA